MASTIPLLTAHRLLKTFASRVLFENLSFGIDEGARVGLVGQNGAGKSTLLRILAKAAEADSGDVIYRKGVSVAIVDQTYRTTESDLPLEVWFDEQLQLKGIDSRDASVQRRLNQAVSELSLKPSLGRTLNELSGGWKRRAQLALALSQDPSLLLLDEPTNHLDIESILWLEDFLKNRRTATVVVSHDRLFLDRFASSIYELDRRYKDGVLVVDGSFSTFLERKAEITEQASETERRLANRLRREKDWLSRGPKARQTKQKARIEAADTLEDKTKRAREINSRRNLDISFESTERAPDKLIEVTAFRHRLWGQLDLIVQSRSRIGLIGRNGSGKSSLIKALLFGEEGQVVSGDQLSGRIRRAPNLAFEYFEQGRETIDETKTLAQNLSETDSVVEAGRVVNVHAYLNRFGFRTEQAGLPAARLSGGEKARLRIAQALLKPSMLLVLDEPTNDLDFETLATLEEALDSYQGAILVVSHDRAFLDSLADELYAFDLTDDHSLIRFADYWQWEQAWRERKAHLSEKEKISGSEKSKLSQHKGDFQSHESVTHSLAQQSATKHMSFKDKYELEQMESRIQTLESELHVLETRLNKGETLSDLEYKDMARLQSAIEQMFERWNELEALKAQS